MEHDVVPYLDILRAYRACQQNLQLVVKFVGHQTIPTANALIDVAFLHLLGFCIRCCHRTVLRVQLAIVSVLLVIDYCDQVIQYIVLVQVLQRFHVVAQQRDENNYRVCGECSVNLFVHDHRETHFNVLRKLRLFEKRDAVPHFNERLYQIVHNAQYF